MKGEIRTPLIDDGSRCRMVPKMLETLDDVPWHELEHAYGDAADVPEQVRALLSPDPVVRDRAMTRLWGTVYHQGTRFSASPAVVPFLLELAGAPGLPCRGEVLHLLALLVTGFFSLQERPERAAGGVHFVDGAPEPPPDDSWTRAYIATLDAITASTEAGLPILSSLLADGDPAVRAQAAFVLAALPHRADVVPHLRAAFAEEAHPQVRAGLVFALGEHGVAVSTEDPEPMVRLMAACVGARVAPAPELAEVLVSFLNADLPGYAAIPGAGGPSSGDAAFALAQLGRDPLRSAVPELLAALRQARGFNTAPIARALLAAAFGDETAPTELTPLQDGVLRGMLATDEVWSIGNLFEDFRCHGLPFDRSKLASRMGASVTADAAADAVRSARFLAEIGHHGPAGVRFDEALRLDPNVLDRVLEPAEAWLRWGETLAARGDDAAARAALEHATRLDPVASEHLRVASPLRRLT